MEKKARKMQMSKCYPFRPVKKEDAAFVRIFQNQTMECLMYRQERCVMAIARDENTADLIDPMGTKRRYIMHDQWKGFTLARLLHRISKEIYRRQLAALKGEGEHV